MTIRFFAKHSGEDIYIDADRIVAMKSPRRSSAMPVGCFVVLDNDQEIFINGTELSEALEMWKGPTPPERGEI